MAEVDRDMYTKLLSITPTYHRDTYPAIVPTSSSASRLIILITGGGTGIGAAAARVWAEAGAEGIILTGRRLAPLEATKEQLENSYENTKVLAVQADSTNNEAVRAVFDKVKGAFGRTVDVVLNNAGYGPPKGKIGETTPEEWSKVVDINLLGVYTLLHNFIATHSNPSKPTGTFLTVSSGAAALTAPTLSAYTISKLGSQRLIEHAQLEYPSLSLFTTMPGITETDMMTDDFRPFVGDDIRLTGMLALWLTLNGGQGDRAEFLRGGMVSVNWDVEELVKAKEEIVEGKLLWTSWLSNVMPFYGKKGLQSI